MGLGGNYMNHVKLDIDASTIPNGANGTFEYKNSFSPILLFTYRFYLHEKLGFNIDLPLQFHNYSLNKVIIDGIETPISALSQEAQHNYSKISAAGLGFRFGCIIHV